LREGYRTHRKAGVLSYAIKSGMLQPAESCEESWMRTDVQVFVCVHTGVSDQTRKPATYGFLGQNGAPEGHGAPSPREAKI